MKKLLAMGLATALAVGTLGTGTVAAEEEGTVEIMPISAEVTDMQFFDQFAVQQDGLNFTIIVEENASTGYTWSYDIKDPEVVEFVDFNVAESDTGLMGSPSDKGFNFTILGDGVTSIAFTYARSFGDEAPAKHFQVLVYKNGDTVIVEEDGIVTIDAPMDQVEVIAYELGSQVFYNEEAVVSDVDVQVIDGITMVPLRATLEAMGYTVTWNGETQSVDISKGAQWTSITLGNNAYFRNRMAPWALSAAPVAVNQRTLVPVEFFGEIIGNGITLDSKVISINEHEVALKEGFVKAIAYDETGTMTITLSSDLESDDPMFDTIIHTSDAYTIFQKEVNEGDFVKVITAQIMTMSLPAQTSGYVIY